jgi:hypothetical protein
MSLKTMLAALDAAVKAATPGPLIQDGRTARDTVGIVARHCSYDETGDDANASAALHVAAVNAAPVLLAIARAAAEYRLASKRVEASESAHHDGHDCDCISAWDACDSAYAALFAALDRAEAEAT